MKKVKSDIRIRFTKKMIQESLVELMAKKSILNIKVQEICDHAGISRSTFYTYYDDQYDLLKQIEDQTFKAIEHITQNYRRDLGKNGTLGSAAMDEAMQGFIKYIAENNDSIQVLLSDNGDYLFQKRFFHNNIKQLQEYRDVKEKKGLDDETIKYYSLFAVGGLLVVIQDWLKNGMNIPAPKMAKILAGLMHRIMK